MAVKSHGQQVHADEGVELDVRGLKKRSLRAFKDM